MAHPHAVAEIVESRPDQRIIVVSAPGADETTDLRITSQLRNYISQVKARDGDAMVQTRDEILDRFDCLYSDLPSDKRQEMRQLAARKLTYVLSKSPDHIESIGEYLSAKYFASLSGGCFIEPYWVSFSSKGELLRGETELPIDMLHSERPLIIPGYYGYDNARNRHLLGGGGSDRTGALAAVSIGKAIGDQNVTYENWTHVEGILSGDPKVVANPRLIPEITRHEVREGAHGGTGVLQGDTIVDLNGSDIITVVKDTFNPSAPGTRIVNCRDATSGNPVVAVTGRDDLIELTIKDLGMADRPGYAASLLSDLGADGLSIEHMPSSQDTLSITLHNDGTSQRAIQHFAEIVRDYKLSSHGTIEVNGRGVVYMVGEQLKDKRQSRDTLHRVLGLAIEKDIDVYDVVSNSSSPCIALLTDPATVDTLVRHIHTQEIEKVS